MSWIIEIGCLCKTPSSFKRVNGCNDYACLIYVLQ